ncbi:MAG: thioredoxin family protein [Anaerolineae bacterium]|nr:thioredoxin family protein [Anaerolineae bacterium]
MIERLLILAAFALVITMIALVWRMAQRRHLAALVRRGIAEPGAPGAERLPTILYFTTPDCAQCRLRQTPILEQLLLELDHAIVLRKVDALEREDLARRYGVLTVPTTVILDAAGRPRAINHGLATADRLRRQIENLS